MPEIPTQPATSLLTEQPDTSSNVAAGRETNAPYPVASVAGLVRLRALQSRASDNQDQSVALAQASEPAQKPAASTTNSGNLLTSLPQLDPASDSSAAVRSPAEEERTG